MGKAKITSIFSLLLFPFFISSCYKEKPKPIKKDEVTNDIIEENDKGTNNVIEYNPLIQSDKYHKGYEKRKYSSLFPYEPIITYGLPRIDLTAPNTAFLTYTYNKDSIPWASMTFAMSNCDSKYRISPTSIQARQRGNTTRSAAKKSLNLKFDEKVNLLGLNNGNKFKRWVLNAMAFDVSGMRDKIAYYLGKQMFNNNKLYTTDTHYAELYVNGVYWGLYLVQERQQVAKNRVNVDDVEKREPIGSYKGTDIGYFFEYDFFNQSVGNTGNVFVIDMHDDGLLTFIDGKKGVSARRTDSRPDLPIASYEVKSEIYDRSQVDFLGNYVDKVYDIMYDAIYNKKYYEFNEDYTDIIEITNTNSYEVLNKIININSFVDMFLFQEIVMDIDVAQTSKYFQVDFSSKGDKKLAFTALWDHDFCFGNHNSYDNWRYELFNPTYKNTQCAFAWLTNMANEKWFMELCSKRWRELLDNGVLYNTLHYIDEFAITYEDALIRNHEKWGYLCQNNYRLSAWHRARLTTYKGAKNYVFDWLISRYNTLNRFFGDSSRLFTA